MTLLSILQAPFIAVIFYVLPYIVAMIVIVFIHELGHFLAARRCGVGVEAFSIGFGKEIWGFNDKYNTRWKFCWVPLGGYVKFVGDANAASKPSADMVPGSLQAAKLWKRALIVAAGPAANFLLTILIFTAFFALIGITTVAPKIGTLVPDGAAKAAGLLPGDIIRKIDGQAVTDFGEIRQLIFMHGESPVVVTIERAGEEFTASIIPKTVEIDDGMKGKLRVSQLGVGPDLSPENIVSRKLSIPSAVAKGVSESWSMVKLTVQVIGKMIMGTQSTDQLRGPIGAAEVAGTFVAQGGSLGFIEFIAKISLAVGLFNLFPIPMLDGGHLVFYAVEAILGRPVSPQAQEWSFRIGLSFILLFMVFVTLGDIGRFAANHFGG